MRFDNEILEKYKLATDAYYGGDYEKAIAQFSELITDAIKEESTEVDLAECMRLTIEAYRNLGHEQIVERANTLFGHNLLERYYYVVRHFLDHRFITNAQKIAEEIYQHIPISQPEKSIYLYDEGISSIEKSQVGIYPCAVASAQGPREAMEDTFLLTSIGRKSQIALFGVFDGHGGSECAEFVRDHLPSLLEKKMEDPTALDDVSMYNAISKTFIELDDFWAETIGKKRKPSHSGTTASVAILIAGKVLWVANVGDSRTVLGKNRVAIQLSEDAKPTNAKYYNEILQRGGKVRWGRVDGSLDMARAIGDVHHPSISARPTIRKYDLKQLNKQEQNLLIIACDGLWSVTDPQSALESIVGLDIVDGAEQLKILAYRKGSWDNFTAIVVKL